MDETKESYELGSFTGSLSMNNITFHGKDARIYLTLTHDGRLEIGPGLSRDTATQEIARMLADKYHKLVASKDR